MTNPSDEQPRKAPTGRIRRIGAGEATIARLPILGNVKVGMKTKSRSGKEIPTSLDYFVATGKYAHLFAEHHGERPNVLPIAFPDDDPLYACNERYECRDADGRLVATGDGDVWRIWHHEAYKIMTTEEARSLGIDMRALGKWSVILTLRFILLRVTSVLGVWQFSTKGDKSSIPAIRETFDRVREYCGGSLVNVPFDLTVEFAKSQQPGSTSRFPVVNLVPNLGQEQMFLLAEMAERGEVMRGIVSAERLLPTPPRPQLPPGKEAGGGADAAGEHTDVDNSGIVDG